MTALSTGQSGKIAEHFLACAVLSASGGRLSPFLPMSDDHGVDLIVADARTAETIGVQVKSWRTELGVGRRTAQFDVRKATFVPTPRIALAMLVLDPTELVLDPTELVLETAWLVPMDEVPSVSVDQADKYALTPSRSPDSKDRYSVYRHEIIASMLGELGGMLGRLG